MSILIVLFDRLLASLFRAERLPPDPEIMSLRDWADLPPHHPCGDDAPC